MMMQLLVSLGAIAVLAAAPLRAAEAQLTTWKIDGETRQAIVYPPSVKTPSGKAPLILSFHGRGDDMRNFQLTSMHRAWPEAVVVYFQGLPGNRDGVSGWQVERGQNEDRDLKLVDAALAALRRQFSVDDGRVYATGFSNGALFTYLLWAERPEIFAAFAPVSGRLRPSVQLKQSRPVVHVAGTTDRTIAFSAQREAIDATRTANGASDPGVSCGGGCTVYGADSKAPVLAWIHPGGHEYPDGTSERIVAFLRDHPPER